MDTIKRISVLLAVLALVPLAWGQIATNEQPATNESPFSLTIDLVDGSRLIGVPGIASISVQTAYAKLDIALKQVRSITMEKDRELAVFEMRNGDRVKGAMILKTLDLQTAFGKVSVELDHIRELSVVLASEALSDALKRGLVLHYSFDMDEGSKVTDKSGNGNHGQVRGAKWIAKGVIGGAYSFNGEDSYIEIGDKDSLDPHLNSMTVSAWVKTTGIIHARIFSKGSHGGTQDGYALMEYDSPYTGRGRAVLLFTVAGVEHRVHSDRPIGDGEWKHLVGVINRTGNMEIYVNGVKQAATVSIADHASVNVGEQSHEARIGVSCWPDGSQRLDEYWSGTIDEVMIFDRALSQDEIQRMYNMTQN